MVNFFNITSQPRHGCPCAHSPFLEFTTPQEDGRHRLKQQQTTLQLEHRSKTGEIKNCLHLGKLHHELHISSLSIMASGSANIVLASLSFDTLIEQPDRTSRRFISFDLQIPQEEVFSYAWIERIYGSKQKLYKVIGSLHDLGRRLTNPEDVTHGQRPSYAATSHYQDQLIRHTEQLLIAYLQLPGAAEMVGKRLISKIRSLEPGSTSAKIYNMTLHMHSTKTCCAPCEYTLVGWMNYGSFASHFSRFCRTKQDVLPLRLPQQSNFQLLVTVTASSCDKTHRAPPQLKRHPSAIKTAISVKNPLSSQKVFLTLFTLPYEKARLPLYQTLSNRTVVISGSDTTPGSIKTRRKVTEEHQKEDLSFDSLIPLFRHNTI